MRKSAILIGAGVMALTALVVPAWGEPPGTPQVQSTIETTPSGSTGDNADDPAIWVNTANPADSRVITNEKKARRLVVYNLQGRVTQVISDGVFFGNVDVRGDWVVATHNGIAVYKMVGGQLVNAREAAGNATTAGEGLCLWQDGNALYAINNVKDTFRMRVHPLTDADGDGLLQVQKPVKDWTNASEGESCVVDDATDTLYMSVEDVGIYRMNLAAPGTTKTLLVPLSSNLTADIEGLALNGPVLVASSQNVANPQANWYATFNKVTGAFLGNFRVSAGPSSDDCDETDGLEVYQGNLGPDFPKGIFVCQDGYNQAPGTSGAQNFKFVPIEAIPVLYQAPPVDPTTSAPTQTTPTETTPTQTTPTETTPTETTPTETTPTETTPTETTPTETIPTETTPTETTPTTTQPSCG